MSRASGMRISEGQHMLYGGDAREDRLRWCGHVQRRDNEDVRRLNH